MSFCFHNSLLCVYDRYYGFFICALHITFGGMCCWRRIGVARVFAIEIEGRKYPFKLRPPAALQCLKPPTGFCSAGVHVTVQKP